jgi:hypothetical protein
VQAVQIIRPMREVLIQFVINVGGVLLDQTTDPLPVEICQERRCKTIVRSIEGERVSVRILIAVAKVFDKRIKFLVFFISLPTHKDIIEITA